MATPAVQRVTKASSDQLLSKFAELDSDSPRPQCRLQIIKGPMAARRKRSKRVVSGLGARDLEAGRADTSAAAATATVRRRRSGGLGDWNKALLPPSSRRSVSSLRRMGTAKAERGAAALIAALEKTWRKTVEGASKMFIEKHCSTHIRLINDAV